MKDVFATAAVIIIALLISSCGQFGGLYLPNHPPAHTSSSHR
jgi:predicted small lipoprotein YifL